MIIINTGIPKSGTTLVLRYEEDFIREVSESNGLEEIRNRSYSGFLNCIDEDAFNMMLDVQAKYGDFVVKIHTGPNEWIMKLIEDHDAKVTCCYRDPRDVILSAMDHGIKTRKDLDKSGAFKNIYTIEDGAKEIKKWTNIFDSWQENGNAFMVKYEDFIENKRNYIKRMVDFFGLDLSENIQIKIYNRHEDAKVNAWNYNKGTTFRWKSEMCADDVQLCNQLVSEEILRMGYDIDKKYEQDV